MGILYSIWASAYMIWFPSNSKVQLEVSRTCTADVHIAEKCKTSCTNLQLKTIWQILEPQLWWWQTVTVIQNDYQKEKLRNIPGIVTNLYKKLMCLLDSNWKGELFHKIILNITFNIRVHPYKTDFTLGWKVQGLLEPKGSPFLQIWGPAWNMQGRS